MGLSADLFTPLEDILDVKPEEKIHFCRWSVD